MFYWLGSLNVLILSAKLKTVPVLTSCDVVVVVLLAEEYLVIAMVTCAFKQSAGKAAVASRKKMLFLLTISR